MIAARLVVLFVALCLLVGGTMFGAAALALSDEGRRRDSSRMTLAALVVMVCALVFVGGAFR